MTTHDALVGIGLGAVIANVIIGTLVFTFRMRMDWTALMVANSIPLAAAVITIVVALLTGQPF
jgi:hypothetical protein